ncbi:MAG: hypothetical protein NT126_09710 [Bacteroidetes bacterium]|nr:hypothetical protein [Bacteroidota bacterium]
MKFFPGKFLLLVLLNQLVVSAQAQKPEDFKILDIDNKNAVSSIEISPDKKTLAIATSESAILFWDIESQKVIRKINLTGYRQGPYLDFSNDGKYLLLLQQFYTDWALNKDRPSKAEVMEVATGKILVSKDRVHCAAITPDNQSLLGLSGNDVIFWNIQNGEVERKLTLKDAMNAVAISPSGNLLVISQKPTADDLKNIPSVREDKKAVKEALKFREVVYFYDAKTFEKRLVVSDIFDIVFSMRFSADGNSLYLFNAPNTHLRASSGAERNGYIQAVNVDDGTSSRVIFPTSATEPQYKESPDRQFFAATSIESRFRVLNSVNVFYRETGNTFTKFVNDFRFTEDVHTGRASFEFLPDGNTMMIGYGSRLALWKFQ